MKKQLLVIAAICMTIAANAKIIRVNNVAGSSAQYSAVSDALEAAGEGDTIMVEGSNTSYGAVTINKPVVLLGPGYWLTDNGIVKEGASEATFARIIIEEGTDGVVISGINVSQYMKIEGAKTVITRCRLTCSNAPLCERNRCELRSSPELYYGNGDIG